MEDNFQKALLSLVSVVVGWFLGQGASLIGKWREERNLKRALLNELEDLQSRGYMILNTYKRSLQIFSLKGVDMGVALKFTDPIYQKYYPDICFKLKRTQRQSYELIHGHVEAINKTIDAELALAVDFNRNRKDDVLQQYGDIIQGQYINVCTLLWHIEFHLKHKDNPLLGELDSETHRGFLKDTQTFYESMHKILEKGKTLKREDFEKILNEKDVSQ